MPTRGREFLKGVLGPLPVVALLVGFALSMDGISQWAARTDRDWANFQGLLNILIGASLAALVGLLVAVIVFWRRSRWVAYGILASFVGLLLLLAAGALVLVAGMPGHD